MEELDEDDEDEASSGLPFCRLRRPKGRRRRIRRGCILGNRTSNGQRNKDVKRRSVESMWLLYYHEYPM